MSNFAIQVDNLSKQYRIGQRQQYKTLKSSLTDTLLGTFRRLTAMGQPLSEGERNHSKARIWALKDISFEVGAGEVVGIIGQNGAGKSTLLKILSRITKPTIGYAKTRGRVGSLLEVGTGFHPELTGRENVFLNGAILGMRRNEIRRRFDEIVSFAEIEKFIDTPVKRFSSGMYMRLAFAVAAHLEPEILIVDEVLAVGDVEFQKKCLGKMDNVAQQGRTILFVSHNMDAIQRLCSRCILLDKGKLVEQADTAKVITSYLSTYSYQTKPDGWIDVSELDRAGTGKACFTAVQYSSLKQALEFRPYADGPLEFLLAIDSDAPRTVGSMSVFISNQLGTKLINADTQLLGKVIKLQKGSNLLKLKIDQLHLNPGLYRVGLWLADPKGQVYDYIESAFEIEVVKTEAGEPRLHPNAFVTCDFEVEEV